MEGPGVSILIEGEWSKFESGYALKLGSIFLAKVRQRGGDSIYSKCWVVTVNDLHHHEVGSDPDYARLFAEHLILRELRNIKTALEGMKLRIPPPDCFWGQDSYSKWYNWKEDRAAEGRVFVKPTPRQVHALKTKR